MDHHGGHNATFATLSLRIVALVFVVLFGIVALAQPTSRGDSTLESDVLCMTPMATTRADIHHQPEASPPDRDNIEEFASVITRLLPAFHRIAFRRLGNMADAEDAVQDALLSAYTHLDQFKGEAKFSTWITAIVINSAASQLRRHLRHMHIPLDGEDQTTNHHSLSPSLSDRRPNQEEVCRRLELADRVLWLSKGLSPKLRRAFELHYVHGLSTEEMASSLGLSKCAAKTQLSRVRTRLKRLALEHWDWVRPAAGPK